MCLGVYEVQSKHLHLTLAPSPRIIFLTIIFRTISIFKGHIHNHFPHYKINANI